MLNKMSTFKISFLLNYFLLTNINGIPIDMQFVKIKLNNYPLIGKHFKKIKFGFK